ncbi:hypothetical protein QCB45_08425 [Thiomicrorhabdus sp. ZW0627]|uniref:hypothetical protein n=1 Tax=Thiomicrorhabdus sp. ZW0627 TaxID=3039774 RepID=UPI0024365498|nr:hypothetical protein [Thiomicrorhabdus sp. ZW0627]MDG6774356.1 hypothetical protein [Thiomicrorhabdus sp. ZW0627]
MMNLRIRPLKPIFTALIATATLPAYADQATRAVLLNPVVGEISPSNPQKVSLMVTEGQAEGCIFEADAFLNQRRLRYEYNLTSTECVKNGQTIPVGHVVRGQHNIKGTMANSGMGRDYLITNKGVSVTLDYQ